MKPSLKHVKLADIVCEDRFRKDLGGKAFEILKSSIEVNGVLQPITLNRNMRLLAGGRRYQACVELGLKEIPALIRDVDDNIEELEIELFENLHRQSMTWAEESALVKAIHEMYKHRYGDDWSQRKTAELLDKSLGGVNDAIQLASAVEVMPELTELKTAHDARKAVKKAQENAVVKRIVEETRKNIDPTLREESADYHYRIGDAFGGMRELIKVFQRQGSSMVQLIEVDPPYGIDLTNVKARSDVTKDDNRKTYNEVPAASYEAWLNELTELLYSIAAPNCWLIFWFGQTWFTEVKNAISKAGWQVQDIPGIWNKEESGGQTNQPEIYLANQWEPFFIARKGSPLLAQRGRCNVFTYKPVPAQRKYHPTQRPVELMEDIISTFIMPGSIVVSPFLGSGATLKACYKLDIGCFGWDLSEEYKNRFLVSLMEDKVLK